VLGKLLEPEHWNKISSSGSSDFFLEHQWNTGTTGKTGTTGNSNGTLEPMEPIDFIFIY